MAGRSGNGDPAGGAELTRAGLASILLRARLAEARDANAAVRRTSAAIERARQARVRAQRRGTDH